MRTIILYTILVIGLIGLSGCSDDFDPNGNFVPSLNPDQGYDPTNRIEFNTNTPTNITNNSAHLTGSIDISGNIRAKEIGFYYGTTEVPSNKDPYQFPPSGSDVNVTLEVTSDLTNLQAGTKYYYRLYIIDNNGFEKRGTLESFTTLSTDQRISIESLSIRKEPKGTGYNYYLSGTATINLNKDMVKEAGFIYRADYYDVDISDEKIQCEINSNTISIVDVLCLSHLSSSMGLSVRAYMILSNGEIVYNGPQIFVDSNHPYQRSKQ